MKMFIPGLILIGILAGALAGFFGLGGGIIIIPALVFFFGFSQKLAQGTSLAILLPPIGILAAYNYYKAGQVDFKAAGIIVAGFLVGSYFTSKYASHLHDATLTRIFAIFLIFIAIKMLLNAN